jgi:hypothetical protein
LFQPGVCAGCGCGERGRKVCQWTEITKSMNAWVYVNLRL